ncbi:hypothetical protein CERSUDRAFT_120267 [Gelatoporia subvermispora B]|uniref:Uncharacterized protein n=1 Tax=Ceriporiopsis subvermispora (strain B) TaxID=914234 RepID=M2QWL1_CERS8|nr:hypothetical protein CERSUDRAFT_120267 [Gelatoporia subvermispora B]
MRVREVCRKETQGNGTPKRARRTSARQNWLLRVAAHGVREKMARGTSSWSGPDSSQCELVEVGHSTIDCPGRHLHSVLLEVDIEEAAKIAEKKSD